MMSAKDEERIGYVDREALERLGALAVPAGLVRDQDRARYTSISARMRWGRRGELERDAERKQIIPYVVVSRGELIWTMRRGVGGGEARLHHKLSIGVGGHLSWVDRARLEPGEDVILAGARREFHEEVALRGQREPRWRYVGLLNDDRDEVGRVHLGALFFAELEESAELTIREERVLAGSWQHIEAIERAQLESWSQLALDALMNKP